MESIRAHFDGKVFIPVDPVNLPAGAPVELTVAPASEPVGPLQRLAKLSEQLKDVADWPADGASQHEHYLYGTPKQG